MAHHFDRKDLQGLIERLADSNPGWRRTSIQHPDEIDLEKVIDRLSHSDPELRGSAAENLGLMGARAACATGKLGALLSDKSNWVRINAIFALRDIGQSIEVLSRLPDLVKDPDPCVRKSALWVSAQNGIQSGLLEIFLKVIRSDADESVIHGVYGVLHAVTLLGSAAILPLIELLMEESEIIICRACSALAGFGQSAVAALPILTRLLDSDSHQISLKAAIALGRIGPSAHSASPRIIALLTHHPDSHELVYALRNIGPSASTAAPLLIRLLQESPDEDVQRSAARALYRIEPNTVSQFETAAFKAAPFLMVDFLSEASLRDCDLLSLLPIYNTICVEHAVPLLLEIGLRDTDRLGHIAFQVLDKFGASAVPALLARSALSPNRRLRNWVETFITSLREADVRSALLRATDSHGVAVATMANWLLRYLDLERETKLLVEQEWAQVDASVRATGGRVNREDQRIFDMFVQLDLSKWLKSFQLFWCVGRLEADSILSAGPALGGANLARRLNELKKNGKLGDLDVSDSHIRNTIGLLESLFNSPPFTPYAWSEEEDSPDLRTTRLRGKRKESSWTPRAGKAWRYVNHFLTLKQLLPKFDSANELRDKEEA